MNNKVPLFTSTRDIELFLAEKDSKILKNIYESINGEIDQNASFSEAEVFLVEQFNIALQKLNEL